ncbi:response regulator [Alistipes sp. kh20]|uniref:PAS domain-containing hybrid sensor histidine kinase/response regulator n=1 Tax=Alistipes montrealensis TaxID=2834113 RepID=UPI001BCF6A3D|nr:response regulator [Alistipes montrealensis]MBS4766827.1 response regulator [Alistipes montrealensis]
MSSTATLPKIANLRNVICEAIPDMLILCDGDGTVLDIIHPKPEIVSAKDAPMLIGRRLTEKGLKNVIDIGYEQIQSVIRTKRSSRFVFSRSGNDDGKPYHYEASLLYLKTDHILIQLRTIDKEFVTRIESQHLHRFFAEVLDNIAIPIAVKSMDTGRYVYWSKKAEIFGHTTAEMIGGTEELFMTEAMAREVQALDRRLFEGHEKQYRGIEKHMTVDGNEHTFMVTRTQFEFGGENLIMNSVLDISELTQTQASLLQAKHELASKNMILSSVLSLANVIPWECDLEKKIFYCDYNGYHHENAEAPDAQGRYVIPMDRYFAGVHPDYRKDAVKMIEDLSRDERDEFCDTYRVHWFNDREWEWVQVQSSVARRDADGRPVALIGSAQRVTEQKTTELALRRAMEELDEKNAMLYSVLSIAQIVPWKGDLATGKFSCKYDIYHSEEAAGPDENGEFTLSFDEFFARIAPDYRTHAIDQFDDLIEGRISEFHEVYPIHWYNDREYEWVETLSNIFRSGTGVKPRQLIGSARVVTAQKHLEESLREAKDEAERSNTLKSAFLANMSHEIRTPLNAIVGFSELLAESEEESEKQEYLSIIRNSNSLLLQLVGDILDLSKIEAGTLEFTFADHDLNGIMNELEQTARLKVDRPGIEVACTHQETGCTIHTDRGRLLQVLHNFINNAAKFTQKGHIHFGYRKHHDGRWYFYVEDTGCGIAPGMTNCVFDRFTKLDPKAKGTGLGLAISKSIIERLGGEIGVLSAEGQGSTFWFLLPSRSISALGSAADPAEITPKVPCPETGEAILLIAEDDPANYKLLEAMLKKQYTLLHAWNGREAIDLFKKHRPCMILMDIKMPEMDGYEATAAIRKLSPDIPIVAVTAFAYPEDMRRILSCGFDGCLPKPVNADNLKQKISELCPGKMD